MRLCYLVTLFLLSLAPLYYTRQYSHLYTNESEGYSYKDETDLDPFKANTPETTLPAVWRPMNGKIEDEMGVVLYKPRPKRFFSWIWEGIKAVVSVVRMVMDILSPIFTALKSVGFVGALISCVVFPPGGIGLLAVSTAVTAIHAGVGVADQVLNDGKPHPSLGKVGEVLDKVAQIAGYVDIALSFVDLSNPLKSLMKVTEVFKKGKQIVNTLKNIPKAFKSLTGVKDMFKKGLSVFQNAGGKDMFSNVIDSASELTGKIPGLGNAKKGIDAVKRVNDATDKIGEAAKIFGEYVPFVGKFTENMDDLKGAFKAAESIGNGVSTMEDAKEAFKSFAKVGSAFGGTVENTKDALGLMDTLSGGAVNTDQARSALGVFGDASKLLGGRSGAKKGMGLLKDLAGKAKSKDGMKSMLNIAKDFAAKEATPQAFRKRMKELSKVESFDSAKQLMSNLGAPDGMVNSLDDFKQITGALANLPQDGLSMDSLRQLTDSFHTLPDKFKDIGGMGQIFDHSMEVVNKIENPSDLADVFSSMANIPKSIPDPTKLTDILGGIKGLSGSVGLNDMFSTFSSVPRGMGSLDAVKNTFSTFKSIPEDAASGDNVGDWFSAMEHMSRSVEGAADALPTPISALMHAEKTFDDTKAILQLFEGVASSVANVGGFKTVVEALRDLGSSGSSETDIKRKAQAISDILAAAPSKTQDVLNVLGTVPGKVNNVESLLSVYTTIATATDHSITKDDLLHVFGHLKESRGVRGSGELLDVLNQLGTFSDSMVSLQHFKDFTQQVAISVGHIKSVEDLTNMLKMADLVTDRTSNTTGLANGISAISDISDCVKSLDNVGQVLQSISTISKGVLGVTNLGGIFDTLGAMTQYFKTPAGLDTVMQHFVANANVSKSLKEIGSVYGVMEDRLTKNLSDSNLQKVFDDLKLPKDSLTSLPGILDVVKKLQALVNNVHKRDEIKAMADSLKLFPTMALDLPKLVALTQNMKKIAATGTNLESIAEIMRAFSELPKGINNLQGVRPALQAFEKLTLASKDNGYLRKNAAALGAVASRTTAFDEIRALLDFMNGFTARSQSLEHLKQVLNYLGAVPQEVKSRDKARKMIDAINDMSADCDTEDCLKDATKFLKTTKDNVKHPDDVRTTLEKYQNVAENAPDKDALQSLWDKSDELTDEYDDNDRLHNNTDYIEGWAKHQKNKPNKKAGEADPKKTAETLKKVKDYDQAGDGSYADRLKPLLEELGGEPPGVKTKEDFEKYLDLFNNFPKKEESLTDMEDCAMAFDRLKDDEKVKEFLQVGDIFQNTPSILGGIGSFLPGLGGLGLPSLGMVPPLVRKVKAAPTVRPQLKQIPNFIPPIKQMPGGLGGLSSIFNPLGFLGGGLSSGIKSFSEPRPAIVSQLRTVPNAKPQLSGLVSALEPISRVSRGSGLDALGNFKKAAPPETKDIFGGIAGLMGGGFPSFDPLGGLSSIASAISPLPFGSESLSKLGGVMKSMGPVPEALASIKDFPVAMRMPGCMPEGLDNIQKLRDLMENLGVEDETLKALDSFKQIGDHFHKLPNGQQDLEDFADILNPFAQLPGGADFIEGLGNVLKDLGGDGPDLNLLIPDLEAIKKEVGQLPILQEMVDQLDNLDVNFMDLVDLAENKNGWPELVLFLQSLLDEAEGTTQDPTLILPGPGGQQTTVDPGTVVGGVTLPGGVPGGSGTTQNPGFPGPVTPAQGGQPGGSGTTQGNPGIPFPGPATPAQGSQVTPRTGGSATTQDPNGPPIPNPTQDPGGPSGPATPSAGGQGTATSPGGSGGAPTQDPSGTGSQTTANPGGPGPGGLGASTQDPGAGTGTGTGPGRPGASTQDPRGTGTGAGTGTGQGGSATTTQDPNGGRPGGSRTTVASGSGGPATPGTGQGGPATLPGSNPATVTSGQAQVTVPPRPTFPPLPTDGELDKVINFMIRLDVIPVTITRAERDQVWDKFKMLTEHKTIEKQLLDVLPTFVEFGGIPNIKRLAEVMEPFKDTTVLPELAKVINSLPTGKAPEFIEKMKKVMSWMDGNDDKIAVIHDMGGLLNDLGDLVGGIGSIAKILPSSLGAMAKLPEGFGSLMDKVKGKELIEKMPDGASDLKDLIGMMEHMDKKGKGKELIGKLGEQFTKLTGFPEGLDIFGTISDMMGMFTGDLDANKFVGLFNTFTGLAESLTGGFNPISGLFNFMGGLGLPGLGGGSGGSGGSGESKGPGDLIGSLGSLLPTGALSDGISALGSFTNVLGDIGGIFTGSPMSALSSLTSSLGNLGGLGSVFDGIGSVFGAAKSAGGIGGAITGAIGGVANGGGVGGAITGAIGGATGAGAGTAAGAGGIGGAITGAIGGAMSGGGVGGAISGAIAGAGGLGSVLGGLGGIFSLGGAAASSGGLLGTLASLAPLAAAFGKRKRSTDPRGALNFLKGTSEMLNALATPDPAFQAAWPLTWAKPEWRPPVHHWTQFVGRHSTMKDAVDHLKCVLLGCPTASTVPGFVLDPLTSLPLPAGPVPPPPQVPGGTGAGASTTPTPVGQGSGGPGGSNRRPNGTSPAILGPQKLTKGLTCAQKDQGDSRPFRCSQLCPLLLVEDKRSSKMINTVLLITAGVMFFIIFAITLFSCWQRMQEKKARKGEKLESSDDVEMAFEKESSSRSKESRTKSKTKSKESARKKGDKQDKKPKKNKTDSKTKTKSKSKESDDKKKPKKGTDKKKDKKSKSKTPTPSKPKRGTGAGMQAI